MSTPFHPHSHKVTRRKGSKITGEHGSHKVTWNVLFLKKIKTTPTPEYGTHDKVDDLIPTTQHHQQQTLVHQPLKTWMQKKWLLFILLLPCYLYAVFYCTNFVVTREKTIMQKRRRHRNQRWVTSKRPGKNANRIDATQIVLATGRTNNIMHIK